MLRNSSNFNNLILRERLPDGFNRKAGWVIVGEQEEVRERKILAVLSEEVGLDLARHLTQLLGQKFKAKHLVEELADGARHELVEAAHYPYYYHQSQPISFEQ